MKFILAFALAIVSISVTVNANSASNSVLKCQVFAPEDTPFPNRRTLLQADFDKVDIEKLDCIGQNCTQISADHYDVSSIYEDEDDGNEIIEAFKDFGPNAKTITINDSYANPDGELTYDADSSTAQKAYKMKCIQE